MSLKKCREALKVARVQLKTALRALDDYVEELEHKETMRALEESEAKYRGGRA